MRGKVRAQVQAATKYPAIQALVKTVRAHGAIGRVDVVNPDLCDDILNYFGPSLRRHSGCTIIDVNPGACLWSSKLHDYLQPRRHILLEPNTRTYRDCFAPLLEQPGSKYEHVDYDPADWNTYDRLWKEGILSQKDAPHGTRGFNNSILFTGTFAHTSVKTFMKFESLAHTMMHHLCCVAPRMRSSIHAHGSVRMLFWVNDQEKHKLLPRNILYRSKFTVNMERSGSIVEVAGSDHPGAPFLREPKLELDSLARTNARMAEADLQIPPDRRSWMRHESPAKLLESFNIFGGELLKVWQDSSDEEKEADHGLRLYANQLNKTYPPNYMELTREYFHCIKEFFESEIEWERISTPDTRDANKKQRLRDLEMRLDELFQRRPFLEREVMRAHAILDNRNALYRDRPLLQWDNRPFDPLRVKSMEFSHHKKLVLLDMEPHPHSEAKNGASAAADVLANGFLGRLFLIPSQSIVKVLDTLGHGAVQTLLPEVPSVHSPSKHGRMNPEDLRVRMLTLEMIEELLDRWEKWPFRSTHMTSDASAGSLNDQRA